MKDAPNSAVPAKIGKYEVLDVLGRGGMGVVYRARDSRIGRQVAIKTLTEGFSGHPDMLRRFYQEAGHTGSLRHPNIVTVYDFGDEAGLPYIVMEYLEGQPLDRVIKDKTPVDLETKVVIMEQVCAALGYAHQQGKIHRDVKPANIIVQPDGLVKLLDFGIARAEVQPADSTVTQTGLMVGTPAYMAPERLRGETFDGRSDIFSAGVVFYQLLTGILPFAADYPENIQQILYQEPRPVSKYIDSCPPHLDAIISRALAKSPQQRYARVEEMAADLNGVSRQLRSQRSLELMGDARTAVAAQQYDRAREILDRILRSDAQHTGARRLMTSVERQLSKQVTRHRVQEMLHLAQEAITARNWDQARSTCSEALKLEPSNRELLALLAKAETGAQNREQIQQLLREVDTARRAGDYGAARRTAGRASELDPADSRIQAVCRILEQEEEETRRKARMRELVKTASARMAAGRLDEAVRLLDEAEQAGPPDAELLGLRDELSDAVLREERRTAVQTIQERVDLAVTDEDLLTASTELTAALARYPSEPALLRLKLQLEPRLRSQTNRRLIADVTTACRRLPPQEALLRVREALATLPGNPELAALELAVIQRQSRAEREQRHADFLARAQELLDAQRYLEAVTVLEQCDRDGTTSPELRDLLAMARQAADQRDQQQLVQSTLPEAKRLLQEENYQGVIQLLEPVLERVSDADLRGQLEYARQRQKELDYQTDAALAHLHRCRDLELYEAVIASAESLEPAVSRNEQVQATLKTSLDLLANEQRRLNALGSIYSHLDGPEALCWIRENQQHGETETMGRVSAVENRLRDRVRTAAGENVARSVKAASQALSANYSHSAQELLESVADWKSICTPEMQAAWTAAHAEATAAQKVLRFRRHNAR